MLVIQEEEKPEIKDHLVQSQQYLIKISKGIDFQMLKLANGAITIKWLDLPGSQGVVKDKGTENSLKGKMVVLH